MELHGRKLWNEVELENGRVERLKTRECRQVRVTGTVKTRAVVAVRLIARVWPFDPGAARIVALDGLDVPTIKDNPRVEANYRPPASKFAGLPHVAGKCNIRDRNTAPNQCRREIGRGHAMVEVADDQSAQHLSWLVRAWSRLYEKKTCLYATRSAEIGVVTQVT